MIKHKIDMLWCEISTSDYILILLIFHTIYLLNKSHYHQKTITEYEERCQTFDVLKQN
jgi:hypothetical protein